MSARRRFVDHRPSSKRCRALDRCATPAIVRGVAFRRTRWRATERASPASSKPPLPLGGSTAFHSHGTTFELLSRRDRERQHTHGAATSPVRMYLLQPEPEPEPEPEPDRCERGPLAQVPLERVWRMSGALEPLRFGKAPRRMSGALEPVRVGTALSIVRGSRQRGQQGGEARSAPCWPNDPLVRSCSTLRVRRRRALSPSRSW